MNTLFRSAVKHDNGYINLVLMQYSATEYSVRLDGTRISDHTDRAKAVAAYESEAERLGAEYVFGSPEPGAHVVLQLPRSMTTETGKLNRHAANRIIECLRHVSGRISHFHKTPGDARVNRWKVSGRAKHTRYANMAADVIAVATANNVPSLLRNDAPRGGQHGDYYLLDKSFISALWSLAHASVDAVC